MDWKWLVGIGAGLWLAVKMGWFGQLPLSGEAIDGTGTGTGTSTGTTTTNSGLAPTTRELMLAKAVADFGPNPLLAIDFWNWYFQAVRGIPGPGWEDTNMSLPRDYKMTIDQWASLVKSAPLFQGGVGKLVGVSGISNESMQRQFVRSGGGATDLERKLVN